MGKIKVFTKTSVEEALVLWLNWTMFKRVIQKIRGSSLFMSLAFIVLIVSFGITLIQGFRTIHDIYSETMGYKSKMLHNVSSLSAGTNIDYFQSLLGHPVFINNTKDKSQDREYIFVNSYFYVQAITDDLGQVLAYSVTTRKSDFNPSIKLWDTVIQLGKTKFSTLDSLSSSPVKITSYFGAHDFYYSEQYYFGNPANYQSYAFSLNESGYLGIENQDLKDFEVPPYVENATKDNLEIKNFRENAIINTLTVSSPFQANYKKDLELDLPFDFFGPDYNQVRILPRE